jgi:hypothetical protein
LFQLTLAVPLQVETAAFTVVLATNASAAATFSIMGVRFFIVFHRLFGLGDWFRDFNKSSWRLLQAKDWQPIARGGSIDKELALDAALDALFTAHVPEN